VSVSDKNGNGKPETRNREPETGPLAGFLFPVFGFLFFILLLFGSGSTGLGRCG